MRCVSGCGSEGEGGGWGRGDGGEAAMVVRRLWWMGWMGWMGVSGGSGGRWLGAWRGRGGGGGWKVFFTSREGWGGALGVGEGCVRFLIAEERVTGDIRGYVERALGENGPVDRMMLRELDLRAQVIDTLTLRAHARVSPCLDITSCARGMLRLELTSGRFHWAALQIRSESSIRHPESASICS